jgi:hypothetical protein
MPIFLPSFSAICPFYHVQKYFLAVNNLVCQLMVTPLIMSLPCFTRDFRQSLFSTYVLLLDLRFLWNTFVAYELSLYLLADHSSTKNFSWKSFWELKKVFGTGCVDALMETSELRGNCKTKKNCLNWIRLAVWPDWAKFRRLGAFFMSLAAFLCL